MASSTGITGGIGIAVLAGPALVAALTSAPASAAVAPAVRVPCDEAALAAAINTANGGGGILRLARNCIYSIITPATAATALPIISGNIRLVGGPGTTIRRDPAAATDFRILDIAVGGTLHVTGIAIKNGRTNGLGGAIQNAGTLGLEQTDLVGNRAGNGGGVANLAGARAVIVRTVLATNTTTGVGGGAILNSGDLTVLLSRLFGNHAPINGGGVNTQPSGVSRLVQSAVDNNTSGGLGGGISNLGTTSLDRSLVRFNTGSAGGGIATGNTNVTLQRSIVTRNNPDNCNPPNTIPGCVN
jgi:hypothetical protein